MSTPSSKKTLSPEVTGAWLESYDPGERKFISIGSLELENGETLTDITIAYQTWGKLNSAGGSGKSLKTLHAIFVLGIRTAQAVTKIATK